MTATLPVLAAADFPALRRRSLETLQVNLGYVCNQSCLHCHVNAGPTRTETMSRETAGQVLEYLAASGALTLDLTGGAPALNRHFRALLRAPPAPRPPGIPRRHPPTPSQPGPRGPARVPP